MPFKPQFPGEVPTLGFYVLDWMEANLAEPDSVEYKPFRATREQADFILRFYEIDPIRGSRVQRRAVVSRPRGWGKSPFVAAIAIAESLADVAFDGWDANGQPVGRPWISLKTPMVALAASTEDQVQNSWLPLLEMLDPDLSPPVFENYPGLTVMQSFVALPQRGRIFPITTSGSSAKGMRTILTIADQTEAWTAANGGHKFMRVLLDNATKRGGALIETPNAYTPGEDSVAEKSAESYFAIAEGRSRSVKCRLYDHREAPPDTDLTNRESLIAGLRYTYGDASGHPDGCVIHDPPCEPGWVDLDIIVNRVWDQDADEQGSRANFLNQITHATDAYISGPEWAGCADEDAVLRKGDVIALGFDGSRGRAKGKPDASALVAVRVKDGLVVPLWIDEASDDNKKAWATWQPNIVELEAVIADTFRTYRVAACAMDPGKDWRSHVNAWEAKYSSKVTLKRGGIHPFEWWMTGGRSTAVEKAVEQFEGAVRNQDLKHTNSAALTRHVLNARRRLSHGRLALGKESEYSTRKIDACVAAVLAWQARADALAGGTANRRATGGFAKLTAS